METALVVATLTAIVTAAGWYASYRSAHAMALRKDRLEYVNRQLSELYGPLYISCEAGQAAYHTLLRKLGRTEGIFECENPPTDEEVEEWFYWMKHVLWPINERRDELILKKSHLLVEQSIPTCITEFSAHVASYRALFAKWDAGDFSERYSTVAFPEHLGDYVEKSFSQLKAEQSRLLASLNSNG